MARVYLYNKDYHDAEVQATSIIEDLAQYDTVSINNVFLKNTKEAIWQFQPRGANNYTFDGLHYILTAAPSPSSSIGTTTLTDYLLNSFEPGDKRKINWINSVTVSGISYYFPYKYKNYLTTQPPTEYSMLLRVGEQYLIRGEARINQGNISGGISDLNVIRKRARTQPTTANPNPLPDLPNNLSKTDALLAVEQERRVELFTEWGDRWFNLKRTDRADAVMAPIKDFNWQTTDQLWPIPQSEILNNSNLLPQNPGYN